MVKIIIVIVSVIALLGGLMVWTMWPCRPGDYALYEQLVKTSAPEKDQGPLSYSQHKRGHVTKKIWYQGKNPLEIRIESSDSELFFFKQGGQIEVVEQLEGVISMVQEEIFYVHGEPRQTIRYLEADRASYNYNSHYFVAEEAEIWKFELEGDKLPKVRPDAPFLMHATAKSATFCLKGEELEFVAHQMRATLNSEERKL